MRGIQNIQIIKCSIGDANSQKLESLFQSQWSDFTFVDYNDALPSPLVGLIDGSVVGGLAYTFFKAPQSKGIALWVNAVFISREYRGQGIATKLIQQAMFDVKALKNLSLYAYTHVPKLYKGLGWSEVEAEAEEDHYVMGVDLFIGSPRMNLSS
ncbi:GNAT family N-acetyltransferase [Vibrio maerlii]|uniref:GNAT family N-acetyltransferase n=1 Tax=Vibrio maerlii TaxID=2231648 RepID=UPI000E3C35D0|nr:GNAT family N-acetyltransferase [Vibrio maerlii]